MMPTIRTNPAAKPRAIARLTTILCAILLAACATEPPPRPPVARRHPPVRPAPPPPAAVPERVAPPDATPAAGAAGTQPASVTAQPPLNPAAEWQQLAPYRKSAFDIFSLTETQAGLTPVPGAIGLYTAPETRADRLRLRLVLRPDSPVKLAAGAFTVQLQMALTYTEQRACRGASCHGEVEEISHKANKSVRLLLAPQVHYVAETTLPLASGKSPTDDDVSYTNVTLKVRRIVIAPARRGGK